MTIAELIERLQWQQEGRLQVRRHIGSWTNWGEEDGIPSICDNAKSFRRRPDPPPMPDEVWLPEYGCLREKGIYWSARTCYINRDACAKSNESATPVRYVRAGAVIPADQIEGRHMDDPEGKWYSCSMNEYRIKP